MQRFKVRMGSFFSWRYVGIVLLYAAAHVVGKRQRTEVTHYEMARVLMI